MLPLLILADEDVDGGIIRGLRSAGYQVQAVSEEVKGIPDEEVLQQAIARNALLITQDKGYGRLVRRYGMPSEGVVLVRLVGWSSKKKAEAVLEFFNEYGSKMKGAFAVLDPGRTRIAHWP